MIITKRADKLDLDDRLVRPDQTVTPGITLTRTHDNTIEVQWWQAKSVSIAGLIVVEDFGWNTSERIVALRFNKFDRVQVFVDGSVIKLPGLS